MRGWDLVMRVAPDVNRELRILLPEEISKLGSLPSASIQPSFASDEGDEMKTVLKSRR
jgi:hypothetical protein